MTCSGHAHASAAFNWLGASLDPSGNALEDDILDDNSGLTFLYDSQGLIGDYTAKFRPWEGGIDLDAVLQYLAGFEADAPTKSIRLRPHLPTNWSQVSFDGWRVGQDQFDLHMHRESSGVVVELSSRAATSYSIQFVKDVPITDPNTGITVDGRLASDDMVSSDSWGGMVSTALEHPVLLAPGETIVFE